MSKKGGHSPTFLISFWSARAQFPLVKVINFSDPSAVTVRQLLKKLVAHSKLKHSSS